MSIGLVEELSASVARGKASELIVTVPLEATRPARYPDKGPMVIRQGQDWSMRLSYYDHTGPVDVSSGYTAAFTIAATRGGTAIVSLTDSSGMTLDSAEPTITLDLTDTATSALDFTRAFYELTVTTGGVTTPLICGTVVLEREVAA